MVAVIAVAFIAVALLDLATGPRIAVSIFYLLPVTIAAWYLGWHAGVLASAIATLAWYAADAITGQSLTSGGVRFWNAGVRGAIFLTVAYSLAMLRHSLEQERRLARTDALTGLANWRHFAAVAAQVLAAARRYGRPVSIAYLDVDNFKTVNDTLGHDAGDDLLQAVAAVIRNSMRASDVIARVGGDEFVILLPEQGAQGAELAIRKLQQDLAATCARLPMVGFSIGVVSATAAPDSLDALVQAADAAMYEMKSAGKGSCRFRRFQPAPPQD